MQAEDRVLNYVKEQNRPFNVQLIADMLAQFGVKKPQVQRALDALAESGKLLCKVCRTMFLCAHVLACAAAVSEMWPCCC